MKKRKLKRNVIALALALILVLSPMQAFAAEELPTEAVYDMEKGGTQTFVVQDADGKVSTVTIKELEGNSRVADGEYEVGYDNTGIWTASFIIAVSSNKIYNAHSPYYHAYMGSIRFPAITRPSTTQASFAFIYKFNLLSYNTGLDAKITNGNIVVTKR